MQFEFYLTRALEEAHKVGQKPVGADMIDNVLAKDINGLEPRLTREGYNTKVLADLLNAKPREIKAFLRGQLAKQSYFTFSRGARLIYGSFRPKKEPSAASNVSPHSTQPDTIENSAVVLIGLKSWARQASRTSIEEGEQRAQVDRPSWPL